MMRFLIFGSVKALSILIVPSRIDVNGLERQQETGGFILDMNDREQSLVFWSWISGFSLGIAFTIALKVLGVF